MLGNRKAMDAAGKQIAGLSGRIARNIDAFAAQGLQGRLALAEELGATSTMASAAGVGGSTVDAYNSTVRLQAALSEGSADRAFHTDLYAANQDKGAILTNAIGGLDNNQYRATLDYRRWVDPKKPSTLLRIGTLAAAAAATVAGGPQAGMAVINLGEGLMSAQNGDYEAAGNSVMGAISSGVSAFKDTRNMGGSYWGKNGKNVADIPQIGSGPNYGIIQDDWLRGSGPLWSPISFH